VKSLAESLADARISRGLTQEELAIAVGQSVGTIAGAEQGKHLPHATTLRRLAGVLAIDAGALVQRARAERLQRREAEMGNARPIRIEGDLARRLRAHAKDPLAWIAQALAAETTTDTPHSSRLRAAVIGHRNGVKLLERHVAPAPRRGAKKRVKS
jgi:transcriptional regulator with XRE-family HTH domain